MGDKATRPKTREAEVFSFRPDPLIHGRIRLGIVSALAAAGRLSFRELKHLLDTTDGNLSVHARKLETAGYVECLKSFVNRLPKTEYRLTGKGRAALIAYLDQIEKTLALVRNSS